MLRVTGGESCPVAGSREGCRHDELLAVPHPFAQVLKAPPAVAPPANSRRQHAGGARRRQSDVAARAKGT